MDTQNPLPPPVEKLQRARIALESGQADLARTLVEEVLDSMVPRELWDQPTYNVIGFEAAFRTAMRKHGIEQAAYMIVRPAPDKLHLTTGGSERAETVLTGFITKANEAWSAERREGLLVLSNPAAKGSTP